MQTGPGSIRSIFNLELNVKSFSVAVVLLLLSLLLCCCLCQIERSSYDLEMETREQHSNNKRTEIERFDWFVERIQTCVTFGWLSERSCEKTSRSRTFQKSIDSSVCRHTATRLANRTMPSPYQGFIWRENEQSMF